MAWSFQKPKIRFWSTDQSSSWVSNKVTLKPRGSTSHIVITTLILAKISNSGPYTADPYFPGWVYSNSYTLGNDWRGWQEWWRRSWRGRVPSHNEEDESLLTLSSQVWPLSSCYQTLSYALQAMRFFLLWLETVLHITPEAVPLSIKSANAETGVGVTSRP